MPGSSLVPSIAPVGRGFLAGAAFTFGEAPTSHARFRLAAEDVDPDGALIALDFAMADALFVLDQLDPLPGMQYRIDQFGAGIGFIVARGSHGRMIPLQVARAVPDAIAGGGIR